MDPTSGHKGDQFSQLPGADQKDPGLKRIQTPDGQSYATIKVGSGSGAKEIQLDQVQKMSGLSRLVMRMQGRKKHVTLGGTNYVFSVRDVKKDFGLSRREARKMLRSGTDMNRELAVLQVREALVQDIAGKRGQAKAAPKLKPKQIRKIADVAVRQLAADQKQPGTIVSAKGKRFYADIAEGKISIALITGRIGAGSFKFIDGIVNIATGQQEALLTSKRAEDYYTLSAGDFDPVKLEAAKATGEAALEDLKTEAKVVSDILDTLKLHNVEVIGLPPVPSSVTVIGAGAQARGLMRMQRYESDGSRLVETKPQDRNDAQARLSFLGQVGRGLQAMHQADYVHGDFKPENMLIVGDKAVVSDLGGARKGERPATYSPPYRSIGDVREKKDLSTIKKQDVFAFSRTVAEALCGKEGVRNCFENNDAGRPTEFDPSKMKRLLEKVEHGLSNKQVEMLISGMNIDPGKRPTMEAFNDSLFPGLPQQPQVHQGTPDDLPIVEEMSGEQFRAQAHQAFATAYPGAKLSDLDHALKTLIAQIMLQEDLDKGLANFELDPHMDQDAKAFLLQYAPDPSAYQPQAQPPRSPGPHPGVPVGPSRPPNRPPPAAPQRSAPANEASQPGPTILRSPAARQIDSPTSRGRALEAFSNRPMPMGESEAQALADAITKLAQLVDRGMPTYRATQHIMADDSIPKDVRQFVAGHFNRTLGR